MELYGVRNLLIDRVIYIGITSRTAEERWKQHLYCVKEKKKYKLYRLIHKYGVENFTFEVLGVAGTWEELQRMEMEAIQKHKTFVKDGGCNLTLGGEGGLGYVHSEETKLKISALNYGKKRSEDVRQKMRSRRHSEQTRLKMSLSRQGNQNGKGNKGRRFSEDHKLKLSLSIGLAKQNTKVQLV